MLLSFGPNETWAYVYLREDDAQWRNVRLEVNGPRGLKVLEDDAFPFEFSLPIPSGSRGLTMRLQTTNLKGKVVKSDTFKLELHQSLP